MKKKAENVLTLTAGRGSAEEKLKSVASEKAVYVLYRPDRKKKKARSSGIRITRDRKE